jgi:hypothetical protein
VNSRNGTANTKVRLFQSFHVSWLPPLSVITQATDSPNSFANLLMTAFDKTFTYTPDLKVTPAGAYGAANR